MIKLLSPKIMYLVLLAVGTTFNVTSVSEAMEDRRVIKKPKIQPLTSVNLQKSSIKSVIGRVKLLLKQYHPHEVLVISDLDGTLTINDTPFENNKEIAQAKGNDPDVIKKLMARGINVVVSSAGDRFSRTLKSLKDIGLTDALKVTGHPKEYSAGPISAVFDGLVSSVRLDSDTEPYFRHKALAPVFVLNEEIVKNVKVIIFCDDSTYNHSMFTEDLKSWKNAFYPKLEVIDRFLIVSPVDTPSKATARVEKTGNELDDEYQEFMIKLIGQRALIPNVCIKDIQAYLKKYKYDRKNFKVYYDAHPNYLKTISPNNCFMHPLSPWTSLADTHSIYNQTPKGFGWKLHISAMPESAVKIANLVINNMNDLPGQKNRIVQYKLLTTLPMLRSIWFLHRFIGGGETQVGKFITIYPDNPEHAISLARKLDDVFNQAIKNGDLTKEDFMPLVGDAQVGTSGAVFTRFGMYIESAPGGKHVNYHVVTPNGDSILQKDDPERIARIKRDRQLWGLPYEEPEALPISFIEDKFYPWPDYMNSNEDKWERWTNGQNPWINAPNPFSDLALTWKSPTGKIISWENRPVRWSDLTNPQPLQRKRQGN